jgi:histidine triad (HIT) family protein
MENCLFCKIIRGEIPSAKLYEDAEMLAFQDIAPKAPVHFLVIPKKHIVNLMEMQPEDAALLGRVLFQAQRIAQEQGCSENGARFVFNCKSDGGQTVDHVHLHVLGGRGLHWPPG